MAKTEALLQQSLAEYRQISEQPRWEMGWTLTMLRQVVAEKKQFVEAIKLFEQGEQIYRRTLGDKTRILPTTSANKLRKDRGAAFLFLGSCFPNSTF